MPTNYVPSSLIEVFPSSTREGNNLFTNEANLTNMIKTITDRESFICGEDSTYLEFVIKGYYFKVTKAALVSTDLSTIRASVVIGETSSESFQNLKPQDGKTTLDNNGIFYGVKFDSSAITGDLLLGTVGSEGFKAAESSKIKFEGPSIGINNIEKINTITSATVGSHTTPMYIDGGTLTASDATVGSNSGAQGYRGIYMNNGELQPLPPVFISNSSPTANLVPGAIWIKPDLTTPENQSTDNSI